MVRGKKVTIPGGELGISFSQKTDVSESEATSHSSAVKRGVGKKSSFRASFRRSVVKRQRAKSTVYTVQKKWRVAQKAVMKMTPHYEGNRVLCYLSLLLHFLLAYLTIWKAKRHLSTRTVRKMVVCQIVGLIIMGFLFTTGGVFNISVFSQSTNEYTRDFYWAMTIVSLVVFTLAVMGCIGIFRPNLFLTQIYAVVSFIFGHLIFSVVIAWYLLVVLDAYLSDTYFHTSPVPPSLNAPEKSRLTHQKNFSIERVEGIIRYRSDEQIFKDKLLRNYCLMLLFASIIMMSSGVLTTKLLIKVRRKQGYLYVDSAKINETAVEPSQSHTHENILN